MQIGKRIEAVNKLRDEKSDKTFKSVQFSRINNRKRDVLY